VLAAGLAPRPLRVVVKERCCILRRRPRGRPSHRRAFAAGVLADPTTSATLPVDELRALPVDALERWRRRTERREAYRRVDSPVTGSHTTRPCGGHCRFEDDALLTGMGVSAGTVEGVVLVGSIYPAE